MAALFPNSYLLFASHLSSLPAIKKRFFFSGTPGLLVDHKRTTENTYLSHAHKVLSYIVGVRGYVLSYRANAGNDSRQQKNV